MADKPIALQFAEITDPGNAGAIPAHKGGIVKLVTAGAETRTIAAPTCPPGSELVLYFATDGGNCVVTVASTVNIAANNTITFADVNECCVLRCLENAAGAKRWVVAFTDFNNGALSTV